jgi:hypothetical protein
MGNPKWDISICFSSMGFQLLPSFSTDRESNYIIRSFSWFDMTINFCWRK